MERLLERCRSMIMSREEEMVHLGIVILLNNFSLQDCWKIIPWHFYHYPDKQVHPLEVGWRNDNAVIIGPNNVREWSHYDEVMFIKDNKAVAIYDEKIICRSYKVMQMSRLFNSIEKIYL